MNIESQTKSIKKHLESGCSISPIEALEKFGCFRLGARIHDLRTSGMNIQTDIQKSGDKRFARYRLVN